MKFVISALLALLMTSCMSYSRRYQEINRYTYQLNLFNKIIFSNSPQATASFIRENNKTSFTVRSRNTIKNSDSQKTFAVNFKEATLKVADNKQNYTCYNISTNDENKPQRTLISGILELKPQEQILFECETTLMKTGQISDQMAVSELPVTGEKTITWNFLLRAEDFK